MDIFSALAEPTRRDIVELLAMHGALSASDISGNFPVSAPAISQHLKILRDTRVVSVEKRAQQRIYSLRPQSFELLDTWLAKYRTLWTGRLDRLNLVLQKEKHIKKVT